MALLDSILGARMNGAQSNPFEQWKRMQANPFTRSIPGSEYLDGLGQMGGGMGQMGGMDQASNFDPMAQMNQQNYGDQQAPTDFAGVPPGLPNLPESMQGFGFGQNAPQMNVNSNLRQSLIKALLQQMMQQSQGPFNGGFMGGMDQSGMGGMGGSQDYGF